jgi:hypothetical protein
MDHDYAEEHGLAEAYLAGRLSDGERDAFEAHYFDCAACLERLETAEGFREGMLQVAAEDLTLATAIHVRAGLLAGLARIAAGPLRRRLALAGVLLLLAALPSLWLARRNRGLERQLAAATAGAEHQRAALEARLHALEQSGESDRRRLAGELEQERRARAAAGTPEREAAIRPAVNVPFFLLAAVRAGEGGDREPVSQIPLSADAGPVILAFELATIDYPAYRASLHAADGREIWQARGLHPDSRDTLVLLLPASMLQPGVYRLTIEGAKDGGKGSAVAACPFRVVRRP